MTMLNMDDTFLVVIDIQGKLAQMMYTLVCTGNGSRCHQACRELGNGMWT